MRRFTALYLALDAMTKTLAKQQTLEAYFRTARNGKYERFDAMARAVTSPRPWPVLEIPL